MSSTPVKKTRAPRTKKGETPVLTVTEEIEVIPSATVAVVESGPGKRGVGKKNNKKPPVVAMVTPDGIVGSLIADMRPLIAHIPVSSSELTSEAAAAAPKYDPVVPMPYDTKDTLSFLNEERGESGPAELPETQDARQYEAVYKSSLPLHYSERLMVQYQDSNRAQKLPDKTDVFCFWCCHSFDSMPCVIPSDIKEGIWNVYGNFCSPECAVAYLFQERLDSNVQWERYAMLNSLYRKDIEIQGGAATGIRSAPKREVLRIFGGSIDIREFRAVLHEKKLRLDVLTPPMVSIIQTMDTKPIDFYDQSLRNVFVPTEARRLTAPGAQGLRLRRSKPIAGKESTLDFVMKLHNAEPSNVLA
jgi:hypothetical protein